ncbi:MAG: FAD-binding protein [Actinobacteria bacterium]|nr:FAD-binding protein [Actinomycetota bacterium]
MVTRVGLGPARRVLSVLARGVLGEGYVPEVPDRMLETLAGVASAADRRKVLNALRLLDSRAGSFMLTGKATPVSWMGEAEAERILQRWQASRLGNIRQLGSSVIGLAIFALYAHESKEWDRIGYPGPSDHPVAEPPQLEPLPIVTDTYLNCDVVIVGSGAGGGCAAAKLAAEGLDVVVVEKGPFKTEAGFTHRESEASRDMYLYGKSMATSDLGVRIIAGSVVGGGTLVNYGTAFRTPDDVLRQWSQVSGIDAFTSGEFASSLDEVSRRIGVNTDSSAAGARDRVLEDGLKELGWHVDNMPRAVRGCTQDENCGYCGFGCRVGAKQSTMRVYLEDAVKLGARLVAGANISRVLIEDGNAYGVVGSVGDNELRIEARAVVVAAGGIETPALLLRSGLGGEVGKNLRLHPGIASWGLFEEEVHVWEGTTQARYSNEFRHWDGGYGPILETVPLHPGEWGTAIPWSSSRHHRELMGMYPFVGFCGVLPRDSSSGRIRIGKDGAPIIDYVLSADDERRVMEGTIRAGQVLEAAGATKIFAPVTELTSFEPGTRWTHEGWADHMRSRGLRGGRATFFSYHQMGSCRMGVDPTRSAVDPDNESHEVSRLFVVDASTFPTASGVNPMLSVYGIANRASNKILRRIS